MYRGVLIDLWGTLVPTGASANRGAHLRSMAESLGVEPTQFARDWTASLPERCVGALGPLEETIRRLALRQGRSPSDEALRRARDLRLEFAREALAAGAPMLPALDALRAHGLRLALVSDATEDTARAWPSTPLGSRFEAAVFSSDNGFCKPDPRAYRRALARLGLRPEQCAYVGDGGSRELTGARSVGLTAYLFRNPAQREHPEYRLDPEPAWSGPRIRALTDLLRGHPIESDGT